MLKSTLTALFYLTFFSTFSLISHAQNITKKPVIGIVTTPSDFHELYDPNEYSYMKNSYPEFVELGGGKPIVIPWDVKESDLKLLLESINGVIFTGGDANLTVNDTEGKPVLSEYTLRAKQIVEYAIKQHNEGKVFPILGVCQGPEVVTMAISEDPNTIMGVDHQDAYDYLYFDGYGRRSRIFSYYPARLFDFLEKNKAMYFEHSLGIKPDFVRENPKLSEHFNVLATAKDDKDKVFVAALEGKEYPFYLVQYHPENVLQKYRDSKEEERLEKDDFLSIYNIARFFVDEARKSDHLFPENEEKLKKYRVENGERVYINEQFFDVYFYRKYDVRPENINFSDIKVLMKLGLI